MARRNAVRRKQLDDEQQQEAMKVLKKYVLNKYRGSMIEIPGELPDTMQTSEHLQRPQTLLLGSRDFERQSTTFSFLPQGYDGQQAMSPTFTSFDMLEEPKVLKEEIKYDAKKDTYLTYPVRVIKAAMQIQFTKQLLCLSSIAIIGLIGGAVFQHLEQPNQIAEIFEEQNATIYRHRQFSLQILLELSRNDCFVKINKTNSSQLTHQNSFCQHSMMNLLQRYDHVFRRDHGMTKPWDWDYWNSVFFAGTVFTTIGYGILAPKTVAGRIAFIIYALISIPLLLGVLNVFGKPFLESFQDKYGAMKKRCSRVYRRFHPRRSGTSFHGSVDAESSPLTKNEEEEADVPEVPWQIAIIILVVFVVMCAWMFTLWEDWTFFESLYFTFSSLTTVGFGDVVPQHPRFALILFVFYICGLFVVSTVYAYIQSKIEDKYMWALQLVDQAGEETQPQGGDSPAKLDVNSLWGVNDLIRWRPDSMGGGTDSGAVTRQSTVFMSNAEGASVACPPSVSAFIRSMSTKRNSLARSESVISKSSFGSKWRPFSNSPSSSEQLTPIENKKMWLESPGQSAFHFGPKPSSSAPSLAPQRNLTAGGVLSVITEVNDEDTLHGSTRRSTMKSTHVADIFPIKVQSTEETDPGGESFEMIDEEISDAVLEDVVEIASTEDERSQKSEDDKVLDLPAFHLTPSSSERGSRRLQRVPALELETPTTGTAPPFPRAPDAEDEKADEEEEDVQITGL